MSLPNAKNAPHVIMWVNVNVTLTGPACWLQGETVGCLLDLEQGHISYAVNGAPMGVAFELPAVVRGQPLYPAVTLKGAQAAVNFGGGGGGAGFRYGPPTGFTGIADAPASHLTTCEQSFCDLHGTRNSKVGTSAMPPARNQHR